MTLNLLVSLFGRLFAHSGRVTVTDGRTDELNDRPSTVTLVVHARCESSIVNFRNFHVHVYVYVLHVSIALQADRICSCTYITIT